MEAEFWIFFAVGALAQLVDGALGMGYGVVTSTVLMSMGILPANVSASVHGAKAFTGLASAISHIAYRNVNWRLLMWLTAGGVLGGVLGAYVLTSINGKVIKPFVVVWLGFMGLTILWRAWRQARPTLIPSSKPFFLGVVGGTLDAIGGGGWGPVVTGTLLGAGANPRQAVGTTNTAEFFVATAISAAFVVAVLSGHWDADGLKDNVWSVAGLVAGGIVIAPLAGWTTKVLPLRILTWAVGLLVIALAIWQGVELVRADMAH